MAQSNQDERLANRSNSGERSSRFASDRAITENREVTDADRMAEKLAILRDVNTKLPTPPEIPGYHLCWLTTNNQSDPLEHRFRLGYELVKPEELPGFVMTTQQGGQAVASDRIAVNEMVLSKISRELWEAYMKHLHHDAPNEQISLLKDSVRIQHDGRGKEIAYTGGEFKNGVADGYSQIGAGRRTPTFSDAA